MQLNADFNERVLIHSEELEWQASPMPGVDRRMLDRVGGEVARATSIVRYAPNSHFSPHVHGGGEEFLVLEGVFQDEHGDFPPGSYIRNPPTSSHTPGSEPGCVIFVKLHQFDLQDRTSVRVDVNDKSLANQNRETGVSVTLLHEDNRETVSVETWSPDARASVNTEGGAELLVLNGELTVGSQVLHKHSWLRLPDGDNALAIAGKNGAQVWLKNGHLRFVEDDLAKL